MAAWAVTKKQPCAVKVEKKSNPQPAKGEAVQANDGEKNACTHPLKKIVLP